ncbi:glutamate-rich protein 1 isoform X2 [Parambassis ranga]|uniref:Glutamate-rich protein 1 isoform X2 n=1 Tax=Parambassis ranga TaxID=210632 RepID=A0A6P7HCB7_9TELE|nr:glutamate-rich protein 1 isoform X2 [Parambassis ranga]
MAHRKEVFQSKVLQKLYPASSKPIKEPSPPNLVEALAKKTHVKRKASGEDSAFRKTQSVAKLGSRVYTVLPPPADYIHSVKSVTLPQREGINSAEDPAEGSDNESTEELNEEKEAAEQKRRRRRKKKKRNSALQQDFEDNGSSPVREPSTGQSQMSVDEGGDRISRNKKRKLKKKRHKEKLLSMGLMPRTAALEFTYQKDGEEAPEEEEEEEDDERRVVEVSDFLKSVMEICLSDSSLQVVRSPHLSSTVDDLLDSIESGCKPNSVLTQLYNLKVLAQQNDADKLEKALKELSSISAMSAASSCWILPQALHGPVSAR